MFNTIFKSIFIILTIVIVGGALYLFWPHKLNIYNEQEVKIKGDLEKFITSFNNNSVLTWWRPIRAKEDIQSLEDDLDFIFPEIDSKNYNYFISGGRKIKSIKYSLW